MGDQLGSLEPGKKADLIILDGGGLHAAPFADFESQDPVGRIVSSFQSSSVRTSLIDGRVVLEEGRLLTMDEDQVLAEARKAWHQLMEV